MINFILFFLVLVYTILILILIYFVVLILYSFSFWCFILCRLLFLLFERKTDCWVGKAKYLKRIKMHGRGRSGVMHHPKHHLYVVLREVPFSASEHRLGRYGRSNKTLRRQMGLEDVESEGIKVVGAGQEKQLLSQ